MSNGYLGYDNKARKIQAIYVGSNSKAQICTKAYVGDTNNKARLAFAYRVDIPTLGGTYIYNAQEQSVIINNLNAKFVTVSGTTKATNAGTYTVTFSLNNPSIYWSDGTRTNKTATWTIAKASITAVLSKVTVQGSDIYASPEDYSYYDNIVRAKLSNADITLDLPISVSGQFHVTIEGGADWWTYDAVSEGKIQYVSQNRFRCVVYEPDLDESEWIWWHVSGNVRITVSIPETSNTLATTASYTGSNPKIYHYQEHWEGETYVEGYYFYVASLTI